MSLSPLAFGTGFVTAFGLLAFTYRLLTFGQRRNMREIRDAALARGWQFDMRRWQGNPTSFRITGHSSSGIPWIMTHGQNSDDSNRWAGVLGVRFPSLAGQTDFAIIPRDPADDRHLSTLASGVIPGLRAITRSSIGASAVSFVRTAQERPTGLAEFDGRYRVLSTFTALLPDAALAARILNWPAGAVIPHSCLVWRDPIAFRLQARLPGPPSWTTVEHLLSIAGALTDRLPPPTISPIPSSRVDRFLDFLFNA